MPTAQVKAPREAQEQWWRDVRNAQEDKNRGRSSLKAQPRIADSIDNVRKNVTCEGCLIRQSADGSAAVYVRNSDIGWLEFDIAGGALPQGVKPGDRFEVLLKLDGENNVVSYQIPAHAKIIPGAEESFGEMLTRDIPKPPSDWEDVAAVKQYREQLEAWRKTTLLK
jgi:hypothetical protein